MKVKDYIRLAALWALLFLPVFYAVFTASDLSYSLVKKTAYLGVVVVCLLLPALFLKARTYFIVEGIFNFLFFPIDIASLYLNRQSASAPFLQNIFHTNWQEAAELLHTLWPMCIGVMVLWIVYFVLAARVPNQYLIGATFRKVLIGLTIIGFIGGVGAMTVLLQRLHHERTVRDSLADAVGLVEMKFYKIYPYNLYIHTYRLIQKKHRIQALSEQVDSFRFGLQPRAGLTDEMVILVIGEAARYDHFGLNGYSRNTTPRLAAIPNLVSYENVYTQANQTEYAVPILLTRATAAHFEPAYSEKSLSEAFQEAGFRSGFLSKQVPSDITGRIANSCDYAQTYAKDFDVDGNYDAQMVEDLKSKTLDTAQFFVLHSLGSHFRYEHRYPDDFDVFMPVIGRSGSYALISEENKDLLINAYDNSILYTDYFLSELIAYADSLDRPAAMVYLSDHGESFWDDERKLSLHSSYHLSEAEYHVPMLVWLSDEYIAKYPHKAEAIHSNRSKVISSESVFYSMADIAGIDELADKGHSICSPSLVSVDSMYVHMGSGETLKVSIEDIQKGKR